MRDSMDLIGTFQKQDTIFVLNCRSKGITKKGNTSNLVFGYF